MCSGFRVLVLIVVINNDDRVNIIINIGGENWKIEMVDIDWRKLDTNIF